MTVDRRLVCALVVFAAGVGAAAGVRSSGLVAMSLSGNAPTTGTQGVVLGDGKAVRVTLAADNDGGTLAGAGTLRAYGRSGAIDSGVVTDWARVQEIDLVVSTAATTCYVSDGGTATASCRVISWGDRRVPYGYGQIYFAPDGVTTNGPGISVQIDVLGASVQ